MALWLDSDTLAVRSLHPLLELGARIPPPGSEEPGPRLGVAFNGHYYKYLVRRGCCGIRFGRIAGSRDLQINP